MLEMELHLSSEVLDLLQQFLQFCARHSIEDGEKMVSIEFSTTSGDTHVTSLRYWNDSTLLIMKTDATESSLLPRFVNNATPIGFTDKLVTVRYTRVD